MKRSAGPRFTISPNAIAALGLAAYVAFTTFDLDKVWNAGAYGNYAYGITFGESNNLGATVAALDRGSAAQKAGIKPGDTLEPATPRDRSLLLLIRLPRANLALGQKLSLLLVKPGMRRPVTLQALALPRLSFGDSVAFVVLYIGLYICLIVGLFLALFRANKMTWAFFLVMLSVFVGYNNFASIFASRWGANYTFALDIILSAVTVGFLIFCLRFPTDAPTGWRKRLDGAALYMFVALATMWVWKDVAERDFAAAQLRHALFDIVVAGFVAMISIGTVVLFLNYLSARDADKQRIKWVVLGLTCTFVGFVLFILTEVLSWVDLPKWLSYPWFEAMLVWLTAVLALTVAYSVIRHRVIDIRFVLSRTIVLTFITAAICLLVIGVEWLFSTRLPASRFEVVVYAGIALLAGLSLNATRESIGKVVDRLLFRQWYRSQEQMIAIADSMRQAKSKGDLYEPITTGASNALSLASVALFEVVQDGGYIRVASQGWPSGSLWHVLPNDPLAMLLKKKRRVFDLDAFQWNDQRVPSGVGCPAVLLPVLAGGRVVALLLCGAHENGTSLDADEIRLLRRLCGDASLIYSGAAKPELESFIPASSPA